MYSFCLSIAALILGYIFYGKFVDRVFGPDPKAVTPAVSKTDGVDFVPMPTWKVFMVQFLNIAGTGPIFGAIMGAKFGPSAYLWIVLGSIFAGGVHDYMSGMLSMRNGGATLPVIVGKSFGQWARKLMIVVSLVLLLLVGTVFVYSPALVLGDMVGAGSPSTVLYFVLAIFAYYILATILPVDKVIGRFYPIFAIALLFMAVALTVCLFSKWPDIPELWDGLANRSAGLTKGDVQPIFPCLFITIACGAISGFHSTQSPLMARCLKNERLGRPVFYGAMITEGLVALVWAAVASYFFFDGGAAEVGGSLSDAAPSIVNKVSRSWLGIAGGILAVLGVVAAPITSGDTAFRSARLVIAEALGMGQKKIANRLVIAVPVFAVAGLLLWYNISDEEGFNVIWRYFGCANQMLAVITLWTSAAYFKRHRKGHWHLIATVPAVILTCVTVSYLCLARIGFNLPYGLSVTIGAVTALALLVLFSLKIKSKNDE